MGESAFCECNIKHMVLVMKGFAMKEYMAEILIEKEINKNGTQSCLKTTNVKVLVSP